jgi:transketolase
MCSYVFNIFFIKSLFSKILNFSPNNSKWINRDRFILSNGHASALLYSMLHFTGFKKFSMDSLKNFRKLNSCTPGILNYYYKI